MGACGSSTAPSLCPCGSEWRRGAAARWWRSDGLCDDTFGDCHHNTLGPFGVYPSAHHTHPPPSLPMLKSLAAGLLLPTLLIADPLPPRHMELLGRGVVAIPAGEGKA